MEDGKGVTAVNPEGKFWPLPADGPLGLCGAAVRAFGTALVGESTGGGKGVTDDNPSRGCTGALASCVAAWFDTAWSLSSVAPGNVAISSPLVQATRAC